MPITRQYVIDVEFENEIGQTAEQMAVDLGANAIKESIEGSGGGTTTASGVIEGGRGSGLASKSASKKSGKKGRKG